MAVQVPLFLNQVGSLDRCEAESDGVSDKCSALMIMLALKRGRSGSRPEAPRSDMGCEFRSDWLLSPINERFAQAFARTSAMAIEALWRCSFSVHASSLLFAHIPQTMKPQSPKALKRRTSANPNLQTLSRNCIQAHTYGFRIKLLMKPCQNGQTNA